MRLLRPADPLGHRRLGDEEGAGDLGGRQAADRAQRERDLRRRGQRRVAAQEEQRERVVLVGAGSSLGCRASNASGGVMRGGLLAPRRAVSLRSSSVRRRDATVTSQPRGFSGTPSSGHCTAAASSASWTASSQASNWP